MNDKSQGNQGQDPIQAIKKAEESEKTQIEKTNVELNQKEETFKNNLEEKTDEFAKSLREKGLKKLETVKGEASQLLKSKMATAESEKNKIISEAKGKESSAIELITTIFTDHIKA